MVRKKGDLTEIARRVYWQEADARAVIKGWQQSGDTVSAFARRLGVDPRRLSRWASRLCRRDPALVRFHPVRIARDDGRGRRAGVIEIELGDGRRLRVATGFETDDLRRVLTVLHETAAC